LAEQLACSTAEGSEMHVGVHGKFLVVVLDVKQLRSEWKNYSKY